MATDAPHAQDLRAIAIARGAAEWRDPSSAVRIEARQALASGHWSPAVVEAALDNALWDLDETRALELCSRIAEPLAPELRSGPTNVAHRSGPTNVARRTLVILPGNIIGPALQSAYCVAVAGGHAILKAASDERGLAAIVARQFERLGVPLAGAIEARYWSGGDVAPEVEALRGVSRVLIFGDDPTIAQIRRRLAEGVELIGFGDSYSIGFVHADADVGAAAAGTSRDVCLFDQRGCMSPQTIYVEGDRARATLFAHALARALEQTSRSLPRAAPEPGEAAVAATTLRTLAATALEPTPHGLDTLLRGPLHDGVPEFIVAVQAFGTPECAGFGRIVVVKPCPNARDVVTQLRYYGRKLESVGCADGLPEDDRVALKRAAPLRICDLGQMQRPPFGYRPAPTDFA